MSHNVQGDARQREQDAARLALRIQSDASLNVPVFRAVRAAKLVMNEIVPGDLRSPSRVDVDAIPTETLRAVLEGKTVRGSPILGVNAICSFASMFRWFCVPAVQL
jgi:hypothetical protein